MEQIPQYEKEAKIVEYNIGRLLFKAHFCQKNVNLWMANIPRFRNKKCVLIASAPVNLIKVANKTSNGQMASRQITRGVTIG